MRTLDLIAGVTASALLLPTAAHAAVVADWRMDEGAGAVTMVDSSRLGGDNNGTVVGVRTGVSGLAGGKAYQFDGVSSRVTVPDSPALDPGTQRIVLSATVKIADHAMGDDSYDVLRKGVASTSGGYWKMEVNRRSSAPSVGRLRCVFKGVVAGGKTSEVMLLAPADVVDGRVHRLQCVRDGATVRAIVDGVVAAKSQASGSISNAAPVLLGSKSPGDDVMKGVIDQVSVDIG